MYRSPWGFHIADGAKAQTKASTADRLTGVWVDQQTGECRGELGKEGRALSGRLKDTEVYLQGHLCSVLYGTI